MSLSRRIPLQIFLVGLLAVCANAQSAPTIQGKVVGVADGNTITVFDFATNRQHSVRLNGIAAPEAQQDFGEQSRLNLAKLVFGRYVTVEYSKRDGFGRVLGRVLLLTGRDVNLEQLKDGMAWHDKQYEGDQTTADRKAYARAEQRARSDRSGLWARAQTRSRRGNGEAAR